MKNMTMTGIYICMKLYCSGTWLSWTNHMSFYKKSSYWGIRIHFTVRSILSWTECVWYKKRIIMINLNNLKFRQSKKSSQVHISVLFFYKLKLSAKIWMPKEVTLNLNLISPQFPDITMFDWTSVSYNEFYIRISHSFEISNKV